MLHKGQQRCSFVYSLPAEDDDPFLAWGHVTTGTHCVRAFHGVNMAKHTYTYLDSTGYSTLRCCDTAYFLLLAPRWTEQRLTETLKQTLQGREAVRTSSVGLQQTGANTLFHSKPLSQAEEHT